MDVLTDPVKNMYSWWSKIRWFMVLVLFAIGILRVNQSYQSYPVIIFIVTFFGISILNILYHLQVIYPNYIIRAVQITLDIIFATLVVHLTGGMDSHFIWIYLIAVITASISIENAGGFIAAMIGSLCMLLLILLYNFGWLVPVNGRPYYSDISTQTVFLISYTALFAGVSFISSYFGMTLKKLSLKMNAYKDELEAHEQNLLRKQQQLTDNQDNLDKYQEVLHEAAKIAGIDHDINNSLTIISLSIRRIKKAAEEYNDEKLVKSGIQMAEALNSINDVLMKFQSLKKLELVKEERKKL